MEIFEELISLKKILKSILSYFTSIVFYATLSLSRVSSVNNLSFIYAVFAFIAVKYLKINIL